MKLYYMKKEALETLKANLPEVYDKYYSEKTNKWIIDICGENPFIEFKEVPDFQLTDLDSDYKKGEIDFNNCKILYEKLKFISESQASDERLWAGLAHTVFYDYLRKRFGYGYGKKPKSAKEEAGEIKSRFFYKTPGRGGFYRNLLAKCWWVGHNTYDPINVDNHFEKLDVIGSSDITTKINEIFYNNTFSSNPHILDAIIDSIREFQEDGKKLLAKEHIRPATKKLNSAGGSLILDCLDKEKISDIFSEAIEEVFQGDEPAIILNDNSIEEDIDDMEDIDEASYKKQVYPGCKITVRGTDGKTTKYCYSLQNDILPKALEVFSSHIVGDEIIIEGRKCIIEAIS